MIQQSILGNFLQPVTPVSGGPSVVPSPMLAFPSTPAANTAAATPQASQNMGIMGMLQKLFQSGGGAGGGVDASELAV